MADSLRSHIADVLASPFDREQIHEPFIAMQADALLADPTLRAIIDIAAEDMNERWLSPEVRALLAAWRAEEVKERRPPFSIRPPMKKAARR